MSDNALKIPPPPPPIPRAGEPKAAGGTPRTVVSADATSESEQPSPAEFKEMLDFVNRVRQNRGLGPIWDLPEATGTLASGKPLSQALGCSIIKHRNNGPFYALVYHKSVLDALVKEGCGAITTIARVRKDPTSAMWEMRLPAFLKQFA